MQKTVPLSQEECLFSYRWLHSAFAKELTSPQLQALQTGQFAPFFAILTELGFQAPVADLQNEIAKLTAYDTPQLELAADFAQCFLLEGKLSALPYASAYLDERDLEQNLLKMDQWLSKFQLKINRLQKEPSDHLCVYLEVLIKLIETEQPCAIQQQFIQQQLLSWLPQWAKKLAQIKSTTTFYQVLSQLLLDLLQQKISES
ncbi:molecular chaperone TorD [Actinobacillus vicugnae]|uniref:molecular chaperone TorD n=1 Tax=Actinobacillus vicugnae TaxID=2573093 RepID=UPI00123FACE5|nr:molecular chaperone TorD [Actinobacillus vicugnae]